MLCYNVILHLIIRVNLEYFLMKNLKYIIVLLVCQFNFLHGNSQDIDSAIFRVASYNIRYAAKADVESGNGWDIRKKPVADLILRHEFDLVGTQEGDSAQLKDLEILLPTFKYVAYPYGGKGNLHNVAILYNPEKFVLLESDVFWLSDTPAVPSIGWDASDRRVCQWGKFKEKKTGKIFYFFNTHFYWRKYIAKQESGPLIKSKIKEIAGDSPVILVGDFNSTSETPQINTINEVLSDSHAISESPRQGIEGTGFPGGVFQGAPGGRIDYVFVSPSIRVLDYHVISDVYNVDHYPSDHLPVSCLIKF